MLSAFCGAAVTALLFAMKILLPESRYFTFVLPAALVCAAILADGVLQWTSRTPDKSAAVIATAALAAILISSVLSFADFRKHSEREFSASASEVEDFISRHNAGRPVLIYPLAPDFTFYLIQKYKLDIFDRDPKSNRFFRIAEKTLPLAGRAVQLDNYFSSAAPIKQPVRVFGGPVYIVAFNTHCAGKNGSRLKECAYENLPLPEYKSCEIAKYAGTAMVLHCSKH